VPSHAVKGGKRYRYYVSSRLITGSRADAPDGIRVPAAEIDSGVMERVRQFLTNDAAVFEALQHLELNVGRVQQLMRRAQEIADTLPNSRRSDLATVLRTLISVSRFNRIRSASLFNRADCLACFAGQRSLQLPLRIT
jgi:site-specific DNA recombinase